VQLGDVSGTHEMK